MKSKLYTRTGDAGETSLVDGSRAPKDCARIEAYGDIDELNSTLGLIASTPGCPEELKGQIREVQYVMFEAGAYLATPQKEGEPTNLPHIADDIARLEGWIDALDEQTPPLRSFILPGGSELSSRLHVARTVCRRAERKIIRLGAEAYIDPQVSAYINRLSDYLFIAARYANFLQGIEDVAWQTRNRK